MAATPSRGPIPKLCPRCGAFYQDLASKTCPQCFAKLDLLDDAAAADLIAEQEARSKDPEYIQLKQIEDEEFKEQSFGACLGVTLILVTTVVLSAIFIAVMAHRQPHRNSTSAPSNQPATLGAQNTTALPDNFNRIMPPALGPLTRTAADADFAIPGTTIRVYHGVYGKRAQIYAVADPQVTDAQMNTVHLAVDLVADQYRPRLAQQEITTQSAHYIVIGTTKTDMDAAAATIQSLPPAS